jgi:hypothetical protein
LRRKNWPLLTIIAILIVVGGVFYFKKVEVLLLKNLDRPKAIHLWIGPREPFSLFYIHSVYMEPVIEEFEAVQGAIVLKGVRTRNSGIMEYYGFEDTREFHAMNVRLGAVFIIKRGMGEGQGLVVRDKKIYLSEIGERGDRIQLRVESMFLGKYLLSKVRG